MNQPFVCVGGIGGSGTRLYAKILQEAGIDIGNDLNKSLDNLVFTRLFKNPPWYLNSSDEEKKAKFKLFTALMNGKSITAAEKEQIQEIFVENDYHKTIGTYNFDKLLGTEKTKRWGWKEPNSHIFIKELAEYYPELKYIFVIRDGFDMSLSSNVNQLKNWGEPLLGIKLDGNPSTAIKAQLKYWIKANQRSLISGRRYFGDRFLVSKFSDLYTNPKKEIGRMLDFLELKVSDSMMEWLSSIPQKPKSVNRANAENLGLDAETIRLVGQLNNGDLDISHQ